MKAMDAFGWMQTKGELLCNAKLWDFSAAGCRSWHGQSQQKNKIACHIIATNRWTSNRNHGHIPMDARKKKTASEELKSL